MIFPFTIWIFCFPSSSKFWLASKDILNIMFQKIKMFFIISLFLFVPRFRTHNPVHNFHTTPRFLSSFPYCITCGISIGGPVRIRRVNMNADCATLNAEIFLNTTDRALIVGKTSPGEISILYQIFTSCEGSLCLLWTLGIPQKILFLSPSLYCPETLIAILRTGIMMTSWKLEMTLTSKRKRFQIIMWLKSL